MIKALHVTTVDPIDGWPTCEKVVYESRQPGPYQEHVIRHKRQSVTIQLLMRGRLHWRAGKTTPVSTVEPGQALIYDAGINGNLEYVGDVAGGHLEFIYVNLMGAAIRSAAQGIVARVGHAVSIKGGEELIKRWSRALMARPESSAHRCLSVVEANELAWSFLNPVASGIAPTNNLAQLAMEILVQQWRQPPRLSALANQLQVSREHLSRVLRNTCGQPPAQWLRQYRISRAADLLESGQSIEDVTHSCGYCSTQHFIHSFSRVKGTTPARWLRQKKRGDQRG
ncbi:MAG: helix-turn-helix transcriptional regulator [Planctomycetes bacterium]|nr:helix-turn-helix transcriptional regulator [Planctomycetota bacterium]